MNKESHHYGPDWRSQQDRRRGTAAKVAAAVVAVFGGLLGADWWLNRRGRR